MKLPVTFFLAERHELDEPDVKRVVEGEPGQVCNFVVVHPAHGHRVKLYGAQPSFTGGFNASPDLMEAILARDEGVFVRFEGIETDIDALDSRPAQIFGETFEQDAVGGDADAFHLRNIADVLTQIENVLPDQGFPTRDADLGDAGSSGYANKGGGFPHSGECPSGPVSARRQRACSRYSEGYSDP